MMDQQLRMSILRAVALQADNFYAKAETLGKKAADALGKKRRSQINGLEGMANSALKTTDVFDFIKLRTARHKEWRGDDWGVELLEYLSRDLYRQREEICEELDISLQSAEGLTVHLLLIREFVSQLAAHYEYACEFPGAGGAE
jgi:hypothetical protein